MISLYSEPEERDEEPNESGDENIPLKHLATKFKPSLKYNDIRVGDFILVKFLGGKKKTFFYRYICVIQKIYTQDDIEVISQKSFNGKSCFKLKENDISTIQFEDIIEKLPNLKFKMRVIE